MHFQRETFVLKIPLAQWGRGLSQSGLFNSTFVFLLLAINGQSQVPKDLYPNATPEQLKIRGYYTQFPGVKSLKACSTKFTPLANSYELFISQFLFAVPITYKEDVEIHDIPMHKYGLEKSALEVNNVTIFTRGVFDVSRVFKSPIRMSLPGFLYGDPSLYQDLNLSTPDEGKYESFVSVILSWRSCSVGGKL